MISLFDSQSGRYPHVSDGVLARMISDELSSEQQSLARRHVDRCQQCQTRFALFSRAALEVAEHRRHIAERLGPLSSASRDRFIRELDVVLDTVPVMPLWERLLLKSGVQPFGNSAPLFTGALVAICVGLALFVAWHWQIPVVSAAEFLNRAVAADQNAPDIPDSEVIHQRFRVKTLKRTIEHDAYRDISGRRKLQNPEPASGEPDLVGRLASAGVNWDDPLSATSFKDWHDHQVNPKDEVSSTRDGLLSISTILPSTSIGNETFTVRKNGFHPVERTIDYRDGRTIEISEISSEFISFIKAEQLLLPPSPDTLALALPVIARAVIPSIAQIDETELEARLVLNQKNADTGEQIDVTRDANGVQIQGLVETEERKHELKASLEAIPFLSVTIRSFDDLKSVRTTAAQATLLQQQPFVPRTSPLEHYFVQQGRSRNDLGRISAGLFNCSLAINRSSRSIQRISLRFSTDENLSPAAIHARDELLSRTVAQLLSALDQQEQFLGEANLVAEPTASILDDPDSRDLELEHFAELDSAETKELISGTAESDRSAKAIAAEIDEAVSQLRSSALELVPGYSR